MEAIYIGFSTKKHWTLGAELIQWAENTKYSHVYIRRKSDRIGEYIYQASAAGGVNFMGIDIFLDKNKVVEEYEFQLNKEQWTDLLRFFIKNAGKQYSFEQILTLSKILLLNKLGLKTRLKGVVDGRKKFICSELGAIILIDFLGIPIVDPQLDLITPSRLREYVVQYGKKVV